MEQYLTAERIDESMNWLQSHLKEDKARYNPETIRRIQTAYAALAKVFAEEHVKDD